MLMLGLLRIEGLGVGDFGVSDFGVSDFDIGTLILEKLRH